MNDSSAGKESFQPIEGFQILERLGSGGMGTVYRARQISLNRIVALKILKKTDLVDPLPLERLRREALVTARMDHPGIVKGIDLGETPRYFYFVMEYVEGRSVKEILDRKGAIPVRGAVRIVADLARALDHAHSHGIVHRDIKPGNIILTPSGAAKLTDLGLAKGIIDLTVTREGTTVGTPQYMSPEQARDPAAADIRSDIYSLGATFYHMVAGRMPFEGESVAQVITNVLYGKTVPPEEVNDKVGAPVSRCIAKMMARKPERRYQTPRDLIADLVALTGGGEEDDVADSGAVGISWKESQTAAPRRRLMLAAVTAVAAIAIVAVFLLTGNGTQEQEGPAQSPWQELRAAFQAESLKPAEVLERLEHDGADFAADAEAAELRKEVLKRSIAIVAELVRPDAERIGRAIAEYNMIHALDPLQKEMRRDAERALGWTRDEVPPEPAAALDKGLASIVAAYEGHVDRLKAGAVRAFDTHMLAEEQVVAALLKDGDFAVATERVENFEKKETRWEITDKAVRESYRAEFGFDPSADADAIKIFGDIFAPALADPHNEVVRKLKGLLDEAARKAVADHEERLRQAIRSAIENADPRALSAGLEAIIDAADSRLKKDRPRLPEGLAVAPPDLAALTEEFLPFFEQRYIDTALLERDRVLFGIEAHMRRGASAAALEFLRRESARGGAFPGADLIDRWIERIDTLSRVKSRAIEALERHVGLDVELARKGITYRGEMLGVDTGAETVTIKGPGGRPLRISFEDLGPEELLRWSQKSFRLDPVEMFLYLYFAGFVKEAEAALPALIGFEERDFFVERIAEALQVAEDVRLEADRQLTALLDAGLAALEKGDRAALEKAVSGIKERERDLSKGTGWKRRRKDRDRLAAGLKTLQEREGFRSVLQADFTAPVAIVDENRIRVAYDFASPGQLADFSVKGLGFTVENGVLLFGSVKGSAPPQFDSRVGLRLGAGFSVADPLSITLNYTAPLEGGGPALLLFSFYGECIGIRSFPDGSHAGQTAAWSGELAAWEDYFFYPDLGVTKPRKGRVVPYGFNRGERYEITFAWDGTELLLIIDGATVTRSRPGSLKGRWCELKTLYPAVVDDLVIEGLYRGK